VARDAVATRRGFGSPQATSQKREVAHPASFDGNIIHPTMATDEKDEKRLKKGIADKNGNRNAVDDILTHRDTDDASMEDEHEKLPDGK
jgi:hypothetical protein